MRREELYLSDVVEAADAISDFLRGVQRDRFVGDDLLRSAVLQKLLIIGEAAAKLPKSVTDRYAHLPWPDIVGFRNIAVHAYFSIEWNTVWIAATEEAPMLREQIAAILREDYPEMGMT